MSTFPFFKQLDSADCGPTCLKMIAQYYGRVVSLEFLREISFASQKGASLAGLSEAAESIGFYTQGVRLSWEQLRDEVPLPCIAHWNENHFVVVYKVRPKRFLGFKRKDQEIVVVADPAFGRIEYPRDEFLRNWISRNSTVGVCLLFEVTSNFYSQKEKGEQQNKVALSELLSHLFPYRKFLFQLFLGLLLGFLISLAFPFLTQAIVDYGISNHDIGFLWMVLFAQAFLSIGQTANGIIQNWITLHVSSRVSIKMISGFLAKLMRLPISFFYKRTFGDIMQRVTDQNRIQAFITGNLVSTLFAAIMMITYTFVLMKYDLRILTCFYIGTILYLGWVLLFLKKRKELDYKRFQQLAQNQNNMAELVSGMQEIRLSGSETRKRWDWERIQAKIYKLSLDSLTLSQNQILGSTFIDNSKNIAISFLAANSVIEGKITLGMMMAIQFIIGQLNNPIQQFIAFFQTGQDAKISLDRLDEVYTKQDEEDRSEISIRHLEGELTIRLKELSFQYEGKTSAKVLKDVSFEIPNNKVTAIVGVSGSGKSTLLKILLGIYSPTEGEVYVNDIPLRHISPKLWRRNCGVVMQEGYVFSDTIANNICLGDETPDYHRIIMAATKANILEFIESQPLGLSTVIGNEGNGLSTGQKQRILIARAIYKNTNVMFFDEATNALDAKNESEIISNLSEMFTNKTVVVIAHRLSTVKNADQIIVMQNGQVAEIGHHNELMSMRGAYFSLVEKQLSIE